MFDPEKIHLQKNENILLLDKTVMLDLSWQRITGRLVLSNQRLFLIPNKFAQGLSGTNIICMLLDLLFTSHEIGFSISYADIADLALLKGWPFNNSFLITTKSGNKHAFGTKNRNKYVSQFAEALGIDKQIEQISALQVPTN